MASTSPEEIESPMRLEASWGSAEPECGKC